MPIAKETGSTFTPVPAGTHVARCFGVVSLGTQQSANFPASFKVMLNFELPDELIEIEGKPTPMTISKEYTLSLSEKANLRRDLEGWRGRQFTPEELKGFDVAKVCGSPCILTVVHKTSGKGTVYAAITSIGKLGKGMTCAVQHHAQTLYEIEQGRNATFNALPEWVRKKIEACEEWVHPPQAQVAPEEDVTNTEEPDDEVPF